MIKMEITVEAAIAATPIASCQLFGNPRANQGQHNEAGKRDRRDKPQQSEHVTLSFGWLRQHLETCTGGTTAAVTPGLPRPRPPRWPE